MEPNPSKDKTEWDPKEEDPKVILRKSLDDAFTAYVRERDIAARDMYSAIIGTNSGNTEAFLHPEARFWRGLVVGHSGEVAAAEDDFSTLLDGGEGEDNKLWYARGIAGLSFLHFKQGKHKEAEHDAQNALREGTNDPFVHCILGDAYWGLKRSDDAITEYRKAVELDRRCFFAQDSIGFVEWQKLLIKWEQSEKEGKPVDNEQKKEQARSPIRQYKRALETRPDYVNALWNYAMTCAKIGDGKKAFELGKVIHTYNPDHPGAKDIISTRSTYKLKIKEE